eukprot:c27384_g1_i1 orf=318-3365(-)
MLHSHSVPTLLVSSPHGSSFISFPGLVPFKSIPSLNPKSPRLKRRASSICRCVAQNEPSVTSLNAAKTSVFGAEKQLSGPQRILQDLPAPVRYVTCAAIVAGALAAGYALGANTKGTRTAALGGAVALGAVGGATAYALNSAAPMIAAVHLHNALVNHKDPKSLKPEEVDTIINKFGVSKQDEPLNTELREMYDRFITGVIPPGNEDLKGDEVETIITFKNALGLEDPDAAAVHIEIGRRIFRQRLETGDKETAVQERRTFQKLVYVSNLVFGDASKFLLPWKRIFKVTDAQVEVAMRDNAQRLFESKLATIGRDIDITQLMELREAQLKFKLSDEIAAEMFRTYARKQIEENISIALDSLKSRARLKNISKVMEELEKLLSYNASLAAMDGKADISVLPPGIGPVSVIGGQFDNDRQMDELKQLYHIYLIEAFAGGQLDNNKAVALNLLKIAFALGNREAEEIMEEVTVKVYRKKLAQAAAVGGDLDKAPSKASYLQELCDCLHLDPEKAKQVHEDIYRQKLQQCLADDELSDDDVKALQRLHVLLCLPKETVDAAHATICGHLFEKVVDSAISAGVDGYDADMEAAVCKAVAGLRLSTEAALAIACKVVHTVFMTYVKRSRSAGSRVESARELKKMVIFNSLVVTKLLANIKGEPCVETSAEAKEPSEQDTEEEEEEWEMLQTLRKTKPKSDLDIPGRKPQTEITLKDVLELRDRTDLYRTYLLYCLSGETTGMPMGTQIVVQRDNSEFLRLGQLGDLLGLNAMEVAAVHKSLAEQAFRQQAQVILADGKLSKTRVEQLNGLQKQLGLPSESAQKVIRSITDTKMQGAIEAAINQGKLTIDQVKELKEAGVDINSMISKDIRQQLFKKIVDGVFSCGTGDFNEEEIYVKYPTDLGIDLGRAKSVVQDLARDRLNNSLVQAIALLRQKNLDGAVSSVNDLLACDKAVPAEPLSWTVREELADLFCLYYKTSPPEVKLARLQYLLGIGDSMALTLKELIDSGKFALGEEEEEFSF